MKVRLLMLPLFLTGALLMGCDDKTSSTTPNADTNAKAARDKAAVDKAAADARAAAEKDAADAKTAADKAAADAKISAEKATADANKEAADAKAAADKSAADAKAAADLTAAKAKIAADKEAADAVSSKGSTLLADLQTAITGQKLADAAALIKQLDAIRDGLTADQQAKFDSLKKQYDNIKQLSSKLPLTN